MLTDRLSHIGLRERLVGHRNSSSVLGNPMNSGSAYPHYHAMSATSSGPPLSVSRPPQVQEYWPPGYGFSRAQSSHLTSNTTPANHVGRLRYWAHKAMRLPGAFRKTLRKVRKVSRNISETHIEIDTCKIFVPRASGATRQCWSIEMQIHKQGDNGPESTTPRRGLVDTGSNYELVSERILDELNLEAYLHAVPRITGIEGPRGGVWPIGTYTLPWHVAGKPEKPYNTEFFVISRKIDCQFDFILGRGWINASGAVRQNSDVMFAS
jgi:hypothetical protein